MGALKPRGVLCPMEATREGRGVVIRVPLDQLRESLVLQLSVEEAKQLGVALREASD